MLNNDFVKLFKYQHRHLFCKANAYGHNYYSYKPCRILLIISGRTSRGNIERHTIFFSNKQMHLFITKKDCMPFNISSTGSATDYKQYAAWLIAVIIMTIGVRFAKEVAVLVFEKLYEVIIQHKTFL